MQMQEEGVPSTALREVSLLKMLSESNFIVKYAYLGHDITQIEQMFLSRLDRLCSRAQQYCKCRLLCVEHIEEYNKPVLYLVGLIA